MRHSKMMKPMLMIAGLVVATLGVSGAVPMTHEAPAYTADGRMIPPVDYRTWVFLSAGLNMTYGATAMPADHVMFDNVFVNPAAYNAFRKTGHWPDKTVLVLETRNGQSKGSINQHGQYQSGQIIGAEIHVKDTARFKSGWAFFGIDGTAPAEKIPETADCYSCHTEHGAVDTTFVQFYPTLLPIAEQRKTLSPAYRADEEATKKE